MSTYIKSLYCVTNWVPVNGFELGLKPEIYTLPRTFIVTFESCYIYFVKKSLDDELMIFWGKKLLCSLVAQRQILLYPLPDGSRVNRLWMGWVMTFCILWDLCRHLTLPMSMIFCRWLPVMFWEVLTTCCRSFLCWAVHEPVCDLMLSIAPL